MSSASEAVISTARGRRSLSKFVAVGVVLPPVSAAQTPPMGGGYTNVIPIPIDEPGTKAIAGALIKPEGAGPFPAIIIHSRRRP